MNNARSFDLCFAMSLILFSCEDKKVSHTVSEQKLQKRSMRPVW